MRFYAVDSRYGYRRIRASLKNSGIVVSEKVVRRLMEEDGLMVRCIRQKKYRPYAGEISPAVLRIILPAKASSAGLRMKCFMDAPGKISPWRPL